MDQVPIAEVRLKIAGAGLASDGLPDAASARRSEDLDVNRADPCFAADPIVADSGFRALTVLERLTLPDLWAAEEPMPDWLRQLDRADGSDTSDPGASDALEQGPPHPGVGLPPQFHVNMFSLAASSVCLAPQFPISSLAPSTTLTRPWPSSP